MIENEQIALVPVKIFELLIYILVLYSLNKKFKGTPFRKRPDLHQFFVGGIGCWIFYMFFDIIIYVIAPLSIPANTLVGITLADYPLEYPSLLWANILRDIAVSGAILMAWFYCAAAVKIQSGLNLYERVFKNKRKLIAFGKKSFTLGHLYKILGLSLLIIIIIFDQINIVIIDHDEFHTKSKFGISSILLVVVFSISLILMVLQLYKLNKSDLERYYKKKIRNLGYGIITFTLGVYYWIFTGLIFRFIPQLVNLSLYSLILGHFIWVSSAIFILRAFKSER